MCRNIGIKRERERERETERERVGGFAVSFLIQASSTLFIVHKAVPSGEMNKVLLHNC